ncbi:MAG: tRNA (adenosine(37)-N6)-dimethylallyltransferase MiaA [Rhodobacteraceae bacterium]|nr:tRNA (adenosine(37)-N6)-dimethylallyltransferase MiaA [Paracoccaceae bacterium]
MSEKPGRFNAKAAQDAAKGEDPAQGAAAAALLARIWPGGLPEPGRPVLLAGPTASGKSALALALARAQGRAVVNADALQVYGMWRVLTARPSPADHAAAPHLLYGHVGFADYSVGHWLHDLEQVLAAHPDPVITGGTGLYFTALTEGLAPIPPIPPQWRAESAARLATGGVAALAADLDRATAARIDCANPARVQRAWEVLRATGRGLAAWQADTPPPRLPRAACAERLVLMPGRDWLAARIDSRFDAMLAQGALDEVRAVLPDWEVAIDGAPDGTAPWARAIGAAELVAHLRGQMSLAEARDAATLATRRYAKRQRTWMRNRLSTWRRVAPE